MPENPLLPHRKLQELYTLMRRCRKLEAKTNSAGGREAILAGTTIHLEEGDLLCVPVADPAIALEPAGITEHTHTEGFVPSIPRLLALAAIARGLQLSGSGRIALALLSNRTAELSWEEAFAWAQADRLPVVFCVVHDLRARKPLIDWAAAEKVCGKLQLPTLTVDGDDAVAMFRVMQEAALRARSGFGPSVIWAVSAQSPGVGRADPLARLRRYMAARHIALPS